MRQRTTLCGIADRTQPHRSRTTFFPGDNCSGVKRSGSVQLTGASETNQVPQGAEATVQFRLQQIGHRWICVLHCMWFCSGLPPHQVGVSNSGNWETAKKKKRRIHIHSMHKVKLKELCTVQHTPWQVESSWGVWRLCDWSERKPNRSALYLTHGDHTHKTAVSTILGFSVNVEGPRKRRKELWVGFGWNTDWLWDKSSDRVTLSGKQSERPVGHSIRPQCAARPQRLHPADVHFDRVCKSLKWTLWRKGVQSCCQNQLKYPAWETRSELSKSH